MIKTDNIAVSVIIPIFNVEKYLLRCLNSVANQSLCNIEVICINDGSTDNCLNIISSFVNKDKRFKLINQKNKGISASRNIGINKASGKYIFFLDADDFILPQTLEIFYKTAIRSNCSVVISNRLYLLDKFSANLKKIKTDNLHFKICQNPLHDLYQYRLVSAVVWNKLYRADTLKKFKFIEGIYYEDWPFTACLFANLNKFALINEKLYVYNHSSGSIVRSQFTTKKVSDYICGIRHVFNYFKQRNNKYQWDEVRKKRISCSIKMVLSKIAKAKDNRNELEAYFKNEYLKLAADKIISFQDLSFKSKFRLLRLMWHQRNN